MSSTGWRSGASHVAEEKVAGEMSPIEPVVHEVFDALENRGQRGIETGFFELQRAPCGGLSVSRLRPQCGSWVNGQELLRRPEGRLCPASTGVPPLHAHLLGHPRSG